MLLVAPGGPLGPNQASAQPWHLDLDTVPGDLTSGDQLGAVLPSSPLAS
jgi:hypothetical protein